MTPPLHITPAVTIPESELRFRFSRSGGPGGQNVNKVATRVELLFDVAGSMALSDSEKRTIADRLRGSLSPGGLLRVIADESRSQWRNREIAVGKLVRMMRSALAVRRVRVPTRPTSSSREKRVVSKRIRAERKRLRGNAHPDE